MTSRKIRTKQFDLESEAVYVTKVVTIQEIFRNKFDEKLTKLINEFPNFEVLGFSLQNGHYIMTVKFIMKAVLDTDSKKTGPDFLKARFSEDSAFDTGLDG